MTVEPTEEVKISYEKPKDWNTKRTGKEILEDYSKMNLQGLIEKKQKEDNKKRYQYYSKVDFLSKKVENLEDKLKLLEEVLLKFVDDNTDKRTSFKRWYRRRKLT